MPTGPGYQVRLDAQDRVVEVAPVRGGAEPAAGTVVLQATGDAAAWLAEHGTAGARLVLDTDVVDGDTGRRVPLRPGASVVNGGPLLVEDGATALDPVRDGWSPATLAGTARADFYWRWYVRRNPRTAAGVLPDGRLVFVVVDGRQVGRSVGLSITETAELMRSLGVDEALNLDGGGSSTVVTEDGVVNTPSDPVERPVGDAVVLLPGRP
ncbi:phosphodiester glycosidase family protein [Jiangella rhizosphaerae]|uniref:phosphodiester glycosidase family protein n=1 Tax=Jiangella rhizosphaerae TaxID=2293569 RepID=UPI001F229282|nr:phosphodiester glycosidase family protein [Jiangella rhizosphaerae]